MAGKTFDITIDDFSGGLNTLDAPHQVANNQGVKMKNADIVGIGSLQKRFGYDLISTGGSGGVRGLRSYKRTGLTEEKLLCIFNNGHLYTITPSNMTWVDRGTLFNDTNQKRVGSTVFKNMLIFGNGDGRVRKFGEYLYFSETDVSNEYSLLAAIDEGATHRFTEYGGQTIGNVITRVNIKIKTKGTGNWTLTLHDNSNNLLDSVTKTNDELIEGVYNTFDLQHTLTTTNASHIHLTSTVEDGKVYTRTASDFTDVTIDAYLISSGSLGGSPPMGSVFVPHPRLLFMTGIPDDPSSLYWSALDNPEDWTTSPAGSTQVAIQDGSVIKGFVIHNDAKITFKEYGKYGLTETFDSNDAIVDFQQKEIVDNSDGSISVGSFLKTWDGIYFLGDRGFQKYGIQENMPDRRIASSLSFLINPEVNRINKEQADKICATEWDNRIFWGVPTNSSTINNKIYVLNRLFPTHPWTVWENINFSAMDIFEDSDGVKTVYTGNELAGEIYKFNKHFIDRREVATPDSGFGYSFEYRTKTFIPSYKCKFNKLFIRGAITRPCDWRVIVGVGGRNGFNEQIIDLNEDGIQWNTDLDEGVYGSGNFGQIVIGGLYDTGTDSAQPMYSFLAEIHLTKYHSINYGREIWAEIQCSKRGHGIRLDWVTIEGEHEEGIINKS